MVGEGLGMVMGTQGMVSMTMMTIMRMEITMIGDPLEVNKVNIGKLFDDDSSIMKILFV